VIKNVTGETVRGFFERYYAPQNLAIIAVGDFKDTDQVVNFIDKSFSRVIR